LPRYTEEQLKLLVSTAADTRGAHPLNFNDWPEFITLAANTGLRCKEMLFLEFSDIDWSAGVLHVRNKKAAGFQPKGRRERRIPLNVPAMYALEAMHRKKHGTSGYVFHQADGSPWKSILESFRSLLKRCGFKRCGVHVLRHTFGAQFAQKGVDMAVIRDLLGHHSVTLTEKYYAHLAPSSLTSAVQRLHKGDLLPKLLPKAESGPVLGAENVRGAPPLTASFERCYVPKVSLLAGVAKLAYAADSKSSANGVSTTSKTCRNLPKTSFKPTTGADFSPMTRQKTGESYRKSVGDIWATRTERFFPPVRVPHSPFVRLTTYQERAGKAGRLDTGFPAAFFSQYPRPGLGILSFRQTFANPTSETLYRLATLIIGSAHISS